MVKKYVVDEIIDNLAKLEELHTKKIIYEKLENLPKSIKEGNILIFNLNGYIIDVTIEVKRKQSLRERLEKLKVQNKKDE